MKTAMFLATSGAILAIATPLDLEKRKWETEVVIEWETVTVTEGALPTFVAGGAHHHAPQLTTSTTSTTPTPEPTTVQPEPEPTTTPPVVVVESAAPAAPEPTTEPVTEAAAPPASETPEAAAPAAPPATTAQAQAAEPTDYASTAVYHHNLHRLNYSAPALSWGQTYADYAAETAAKCVFAHDLTPGGGGYGQNLALWGSSGDAKALGTTKAIAQSITDMWHNGECEAYPKADYGKANPDMSNFETWGHFSQLVWVGSEQVGCASQYCNPGTIYENMGSWFTVCNYYPAGNMGGAYGKNVLPSLNEATVVV